MLRKHSRSIPNLNVRFLFLLGLLLGLLAGPGWGQSVRVRPATALAQLAILDLRNDTTGFTWVAAQKGVFRYDGRQVVPLSQLVRQGPRPTGPAYAVAVDATGRIWIGLDDNLYAFIPATGLMQRVPLPPVAGMYKQVDNLLVHDGALWLTRGRIQAQVFRLPLATGPPYRPQLVFQQPNAFFTSLGQDSTGALLINEEFGGWRRSPGGHYTRTETALDGRRNQLSKANGADWVFPARTGLRVPGTPWVLTDSTLLAGLPTGPRRLLGQWKRRYRTYFHPTLQVLELDSTWYWPGDGEVLALSLRRHATPAGLRHFSLPLDRGGSLYLRFNRDTTGVLAFVRNAPGAAELRPQTQSARPLPVAEGLQLSTRTINRLPDGRLLTGTYSGTFVQAADSPTAPLRPWQPQAPLAESGILFGSQRLPDGRLLVANEYGWFALVDNGRVDRLAWQGTMRQRKYERAMYSVLRTRAGQLWGSGVGGLFQLDIGRQQARRYRDTDPAWPLHQVVVQALAEGAPGELWLATDHGLYRLHPATGQLTHYGPEEAGPRHLPTRYLNCVLAPHPDSVWVGTLDAGLLLLHPWRGVQRQLTLGQGLPSEAVAFIAKPTPAPVLWVGTYNGLVRYDLRTQRSLDYSVENGLLSNELNRQSVYYDAATQNLYVGSVKGISRLALREPPPPPHRPRLLLLALTQHHARGDTIQTTYLPNALPGGTRLARGDAFAEVQVGLTDYVLAGYTRFAYRLLGDESSRWRAMDAQGRVRLLGLEPGDYMLEMKAETAEGVAALGTIRVPVQVRTYWWRRPGVWAILALVLAAAASAATYAWQRRQAAQREARQAAAAALRQQLAADLHDEVGGLLTRVTMRAELLQAQQNTAQISALLQESRSAATTMRDIIWSVDATTDTVEALLDRVEDLVETSRRASGQPIGLQLFPTDPVALRARLRPAVRQHAYLVLKESLTNALKHGPRDGELTVALRITPAELWLVVENAIQETASTRSGQGLRNMATRAKAIGGHLELGAQPGGRWQVQLRVPQPLQPADDRGQ
jgi:signal transduction histidine kinase/ligand-binding sensor domain-containing protein